MGFEFKYMYIVFHFLEPQWLDLRFKGERSNHYAIAAGLQTKAECADYKLYALLYALVYVLKKSENIVTLAADINFRNCVPFVFK